MILLNFAHPLTAMQVAAVEQLTGSTLTRVVSVATQFDEQAPFLAQTQHLLETAEVTSAEWQTEQFVVVAPSLNYITAVLLAELHGRMGYFPTVVRMRPVAGATPRKFEVAELLDLQAIRDAARTRR